MMTSSTNCVHVYIDEQYADLQQPPHLQVTSLTGVYIPVHDLVPYRRKYVALLRDIFPDPQNRVSLDMPHAHASDLFRSLDADDDTKFRFMEGLVSIVNSMELRVVRVGYVRNLALINLSKNLRISNRRESVSYPQFENRFLRSISFLFMLGNIDPSKLYFYHIENDNTAMQYEVFQKLWTSSTWLNSSQVATGLTISPDSIADVGFYDKESPYGVLPDCIGYLLNIRWCQSRGAHLGPFKERLAEICGRLNTKLLEEHIVENVEISNGPKEPSSTAR